MKRLITAVLLLLSLASFSQEAYIIKKDSTKIVVNPESVYIIPVDKRVAYKLPGKTWEKYVRYKDLDFVSYDGKRFKNGAFIIAENASVKMETLPQTVTTDKPTMRTFFYYRFVDKKTNKIISRGTFTSVKSKANKEKMETAITLVKQYFADCPQVMQKVADTTQDRESFFWDLQYIECN